MAYQEWSVLYGEQPTAAKWNILGTNDAGFNDGTAIADDAIKYNHIDNPYKFRARLSADVNLVDNVQKTVIFDTEELDPGSDYNAATGIYTAPVDGEYMITACINIAKGASASLGYGSLYVLVNNVQVDLVSHYPTSGNTVQQDSLVYTGILTLQAGDTVKINALGNTVDAAAPKVNSIFSNVFSGFLVP